MKCDAAITYRRGYRYQLAEDYHCRIPLTGHVVDYPFILLDIEGNLTIRAGYAWNGASGPAFDTRSFMRGSLVHDALCQLIGLGFVEPGFRLIANEILCQMCLEDGMWPWRVRLVRWAVDRWCSPRPSEYRQTMVAP